MKGFHETIGFRDDGCYGVVFSIEQAMSAFREAPPSTPMLCIDLPRAEIVFCIADAQRFFAKGQPSRMRGATLEEARADSVPQLKERLNRALPRMQEQKPWRGEPA